MTPERWEQVKALFEAALEQAPHERAAFLEAACGGDPDLRHEVESLLASDEQGKDFIETPVYEIPADLLVKEPADTLAGRRIGPYQVLGQIGQGGMGAVYLAERADDRFRKQVAIKVVKRGMDTQAILRRFGNEQQILANLDHANIAKLLDAGTTEDGLSYFIMDYVEGLPIDVYCDTHKLLTRERLALFRTVCTAVGYAHEHHVIHRDLKPSNILVTAAGVVKLLDFGIAKLLDPEHPAQTTGSTAARRPMTPEYASPEQVRGEAITTASDIYSLGVLLYELLTGHRPYYVRRHTPQEVEQVVCGKQPEKPSTIVSRVEEVPSTDGTARITLTPESVSATRDRTPEQLRRRLSGDLDNIVLTALRKEPERRYASVEQFSEDLRRHLEGLPVIARKDTLGYRSAKFIQRNKAGVVAAFIAVVLIVLVVVGLHLFFQHEKVTGRAIDSVAVLPFVNVSADPNMEYLSDGITESLINSLSQLPELRVMAPPTVLHYKGREVDPRRVGRELNVGAVLTGKVVQRGESLIIGTQLVAVADGSQLWGEQYHRKLSDILAVQGEIANEISERLRLKLTGEEKRRLTKRYTENIEAYQLYIKGRFFWNKRTGDGLEKAIQHFNEAIEKDPNYALGYAGLADCYNLLSWYSDLPPKDSFPRAKEAAMKALEIDDTLAEAHAALGYVKMLYDWDWSGAERELNRALTLNPNYPTARHFYAFYFRATGRHDEAIAEIKRAQGLDPLSLPISSNVGRTLYFARQYDQAIEHFRKTLEMDPNFVPGHWTLGLAYEKKGMYEEAIAAFQEAVDLSGGSPLTVAFLGRAYALSGKKGEAMKVLEELQELSQRKYISPFDIALIYAGLGRKDQAVEWLEKACEERNVWMVYLKVEPMFDHLRPDPRFQDLMRRVGLD